MWPSRKAIEPSNSRARSPSLDAPLTDAERDEIIQVGRLHAQIADQLGHLPRDEANRLANAILPGILHRRRSAATSNALREVELF